MISCIHSCQVKCHWDNLLLYIYFSLPTRMIHWYFILKNVFHFNSTYFKSSTHQYVPEWKITLLKKVKMRAPGTHQWLTFPPNVQLSYPLTFTGSHHLIFTQTLVGALRLHKYWSNMQSWEVGRRIEGRDHFWPSDLSLSIISLKYLEWRTWESLLWIQGQGRSSFIYCVLPLEVTRSPRNEKKKLH